MFRSRQPSRRAGIVLGVGLGGFVDGIVLHQILQWHAMLSAWVPPTSMDAMRVNMRADGWFHALTWCITFVGMFLLRIDAERARHGDVPLPSLRVFMGQLLMGWGAFNLVEGVINHHVLMLHHVRDMPVHVPEMDWLFLVVGGGGFALLGWWMSRAQQAKRW